MKKILAILLITTMMYGCASAPSGEKFSSVRSATNEKSLVYIYRPDAYYAKAVTYGVLLDEVEIARIARNGFFAIDIPPGAHSIRPDHDGIDHDLLFDFKANETTFLRLKTNLKPALCFCTSIQFEVVSEELAVSEMSVMREEVERVKYQ